MGTDIHPGARRDCRCAANPTGPHRAHREHSGAGLGAKPIVDVMVGVHSEAEYPKYVSLLAPLGYEHRGDTVPGTLYNRKEGPPRVNAHLCVFGGEFWQEHLLFRNYLRSNPEAAAEYESLKRQILVEVGPDPPAYNAAKARFIRDVLERATHQMQPP